MNDRIQVLLDKQSIYEVLSRYCRGADRCDESIIRSAYHPDSYDNHGYWRGNGHDFAAFLPKRLMKANSATTHSISNVLIEVDGDLARSESQVMATLVRRDTHPVLADVMGARYLDKLSRRDDEWRLDERTVVLDWLRVETWSANDTPVPLDGFTRGARGASDQVFSLMTEARR